MITFQALCHVLKSYMPASMCGGETKNRASSDTCNNSSEHQRKFGYKSILEGDPLVDYPVLLASLLDGLAVMTEKFKLKWQECVETICVLSLAQEILNHPGILPTVKKNFRKLKSLDIFVIIVQNYFVKILSSNFLTFYF